MRESFCCLVNVFPTYRNDFLLPQIPAGTQKLTAAPVLSGGVRLLEAAALE